ncbi:unnamed protein product [Porites lobata]|uniref:PI-PLC X domain-containing protein At5g67130-like n=1 Tax=Porites lobata TaxID=104759 RepID=A0ABN8S3P9_9CNID|nr:unnamed protein product [Porites lobata]
MHTFCAVFFLFAATALQVKIAVTSKCNGLEDLCELRIDQVTYPGSHNAGSGFDGKLKYWSGVYCSSCWYRNHGKSFSEQLAFGIRYFDIDTCYGTKEALNCHCPDSRKQCCYSGSIEKGLTEIDDWLKSNPNEVVIILFNRDSQTNYRKEIAKSLEATLLKLWPPTSTGSLAMNTYYKKNRGRWPTLKEAIRRNQRIFIFMDNGLIRYLGSSHDWVVQSNGNIKSSWDTVAVSSSCSSITTNAKSKCNSRASFMSLAAFGSYGLCTWHMAKVCSKWIGEAQEACYQKRKSYQKTVNFLLVDWLDYFSGVESVINKAKFMNQKNIKEYLGKDIFFPEFQGCSYHPGWFYKYCWKNCPKYGWCWINQYCGDNANICKQKSYSCYSNCGA